MTELDGLAWPEVPAGALLALPLGATEQHGPHLPLSTDTEIASALCRRLAAARPDVVVAPALPYGSSGEHQDFAGTLSIGQEALELVVVELVRSATRTFRGVVLVSAHGGNAAPLARAVARLRAEERSVLCWAPSGYVDAHAGRSETALLLHLRPGAVRAAETAPGALARLDELLPALTAGRLRDVAPTGVLGDPRPSTAVEGAALLDQLAADLLAAVGGWHP